MSGHVKFCTGCGSALTENAQFCTACGNAVVAAPVATPVAPTASTAAAVGSQATERVLSVIPNTTLKSGFMGLGSKAGNLVLTDRRIIFAHMTSQMMKDMVAGARDEAKADGKGFFGQWGAQLSAYSAFAQRYLEMDPEATLAETPENLAIENASIRKAQIKKGVQDENGTPGTDKLIIKTDAGKTVWTLGSSSQAKQALIAAGLI
jgi:hypothetical protein